MNVLKCKDRLDTYLWHGTLPRVKSTVDDFIKANGDEAVIDITWCRMAPSVAEYFEKLIAQGVNVVCDEKDVGIQSIIDDIKRASTLDKPNYVKFPVTKDYEELLSNCRSAKELYAKDPSSVFYVSYKDREEHRKDDYVALTLAYLMLFRTTLPVDPYYDGTPISESKVTSTTLSTMEVIFKIILRDVHVPASWYSRDDGTIQICKGGIIYRLHKEGNLYYFPGYGRYTKEKLMALDYKPLPGFLFNKSLKGEKEFLHRFIEVFVANVNAGIDTERIQGSKLLYLIDKYS